MANDPENPARWLPDPTGRHEHRYWNGSSWSDDVADNGVTGKDAFANGAAAGAPTNVGDAGEQIGVVPVAATTAEATNAALSGDKKGFGAFVSKSWHGFRRWPKWAQITTAVVLVLFVIGAIASGGSESKTKNSASTAPATKASTQTTTPPTTAAPTTAAPTTTAPKPTAPPAPVETPGQSNARRSAQQYLRLGNGFSRGGLIEQLSSEFGEGFSLEDATYGVDATHTDWNAQACLSAKSYLKQEPFSHAGLVEQLSSEFGEKYTPDEAEYGVTCAGL